MSLLNLRTPPITNSAVKQDNIGMKEKVKIVYKQTVKETSISSLNQPIEIDLSLHKAVRYVYSILMVNVQCNYYREGNHRMVQSLINNGYDVNGVDDEGCTPLMYW